MPKRENKQATRNMSLAALVYDGDCPFCANYLALMHLREHWPSLELVDAREEPDHPAVQQVRAAGLQIDEGMALIDGDVVQHAADGINALATFGGGLNNAIFSNRRTARTLYPLLKAGRNLAIWALGRRKLGF